MFSPASPRYCLLLALSLFAPLTGCTAAEPPMAGGYHAVTVSPEIQAAAEMAVAAHGKKEGGPITLVKIAKVEAQVVAGMNYSLTLEVTAKGRSATAKAVVYRGLDNKLELTSWEWLKQ